MPAIMRGLEMQDKQAYADLAQLEIFVLPNQAVAQRLTHSYLHEKYGVCARVTFFYVASATTAFL